MRSPHRVAAADLSPGRVAETMVSAMEAVTACRVIRLTIRRPRPRARLRTKPANAGSNCLPVRSSRRAAGRAPCVVASVQAQQPGNDGARVLFLQILKQMTRAPTGRPPHLAVEGMHAVPCEGAAHVPPRDTG